ncbi:M28 family metallopeptidase [Sinomicrobium weinanense]|uniref:M20/M25/M40 family metallo-hydrolase n=1 Tax=Sinomicrobium weinanense TaxID=2842200 RepID=A0A926Q5L6_9FLAO|nr:M20/M25/M40 family metallo-hydrolase [Sinomicrobium weinanense]MBC9798296.1 M20/M25/M40 family metallo-hydrolase [Sinomicrobium weinanense]MBU3124539.1 M20/M25/M40 family metallo-hydrolase [Sinomicrobium weinanense]
MSIKKHVYSVIFFCGILSGLNAQEQQDTGTAVEPYAVNAEDVRQTVEFLASDDLEGRDTGSPGIEKAAQYIEKSFAENWIKPYFASYRDTLDNFKEPAYNMVGYIEGNDPELKDEFILIGAHYDHIGIQEQGEGDDVIANGANDNASGTAAVLELAKYFGKSRSNKRSLLFVLFSAEEKGLLGSRHLARELRKTKMDLYTVVNFEMIGVPMTADYTAYLTGFEDTNMAEKMNEYAGKELIGFLPKAGEFQLFKRSDNYPFFVEFSVPSQTVCTFDFTNFEHYHKVGDEATLMDMEHMASFVSEMIPVMEKMANAGTKEIKFVTE